MKRENRLPDVILMSRDATDLLERQTTEFCVCVDSDETFFVHNHYCHEDDL